MIKYNSRKAPRNNKAINGSGLDYPIGLDSQLQSHRMIGYQCLEKIIRTQYDSTEEQNSKPTVDTGLFDS